jgi:hypothetical protein
MARGFWGDNIRNAQQLFADQIFWQYAIKCETTFWFFPHIDSWKGDFKTNFHYLHIREQVDLPKDFYKTFDKFVYVIEQIATKIQKEFTYYFEAIWC